MQCIKVLADYLSDLFIQLVTFTGLDKDREFTSSLGVEKADFERGVGAGRHFAAGLGWRIGCAC